MTTRIATAIGVGLGVGTLSLGSAGAAPPVTFTNVRTTKLITMPVSPRHYREVLSTDGTELTGRSVGKNVYFGPGVRGVLYADGVQRYTYRPMLVILVSRRVPPAGEPAADERPAGASG